MKHVHNQNGGQKNGRYLLRCRRRTCLAAAQRMSRGRLQALANTIRSVGTPRRRTMSSCKVHHKRQLNDQRQLGRLAQICLPRDGHLQKSADAAVKGNQHTIPQIILTLLAGLHANDMFISKCCCMQACPYWNSSATPIGGAQMGHTSSARYQAS